MHAGVQYFKAVYFCVLITLKDICETFELVLHMDTQHLVTFYM